MTPALEVIAVSLEVFLLFMFDCIAAGYEVPNIEEIIANHAQYHCSRTDKEMISKDAFKHFKLYIDSLYVY